MSNKGLLFIRTYLEESLVPSSRATSDCDFTIYVVYYNTRVNVLYFFDTVVFKLSLVHWALPIVDNHSFCLLAIFKMFLV